MQTKVIRKKSIGVDSVEPSLTPLTANETTFLQKPKIVGKSKKRDIPEGLWSKCPRCEYR